MTAPLYLYTGPEFGERNDAVNAVKAALKKKFGESDDFLFYAGETDFSQIMSQLMTDSLFTPATCVVLRDADLIKSKDEVEAINNWAQTAVKNGTESSVLILVSDKIKVDAKLEKIVPPSNKKIFWEMFEDRKEQWLYGFFKKNGYSLETEAAELILEMVENNTQELKNECNRFFMCFKPGYCVTSADVEKILAHNREESGYTLFDAMTESDSPQKKLENCLSILQKLLLSKNTAVGIISQLSFCFRNTALYQSLNSGGRYADETTLKAAGFATKTSRTQYARASRVWSSGQVAAIIALLSKTDMEIRSAGNSLQENQLVLMIYEIVIKKGAYCSSYDAAV